MGTIKRELKERFFFYISYSGNVFAYKEIKDDFKIKAEYDNIEYQIKIVWSK